MTASVFSTTGTTATAPTAGVFLSNGTQITHPSSNSVTQFLDTVLRVEQNAFALLVSLSDIVAGNAQTVQVTVESSSGATATYELPSIGYMQNEIKRIDNNFSSLSGLDGQAIVRLSDGSYRQIIESRIFQEPLAIGNLQVPTQFYSRPNWFFQNFLSPQLYVNFDISNYVDFDLQQVYAQRVILNALTAQQQSYFDTTYKGRNDVDYNALLTDLNSQSIGYFIDEEFIDLPSTIVRYSGTFTVINIVNETVQTLDNNGNVVVTKVNRYVLDNISYTDNLLSTTNSMRLKVGDSVDLDSLTSYQVSFIDTSTNKVSLVRTSGVSNLAIGSKLFITPVPFSVKNVQVNFGFNERQVIFIKPIDKTYNVTTRNFSPGVAIYTNDLSITTSDATLGGATSSSTLSLSEYYNSQVTDFGTTFLGVSKEKPIPAVYGLIPSAPVLNVNDFTVSLINSQKNSTATINEIKTITAQKNSVASQITQLNTAIQTQQEYLNTTQFTSDAAKQAAQNQLSQLVNQKTTASNLYASLVSDLSTIAQNPPAELDSPMYRVRGFWAMPSPQASQYTQPQEVIQFVISYRYLASDGTAPGVDYYDFTDPVTGSTVRAYFSNWNEYKTDIRGKVFNSSTGTYDWAVEDVSNPDVVNINQLDIPITKGEQVEIRIKSISEAGWPSNPIESDWSSSIIVAFPAELEQEAEINTTLQQSTLDQVQVNFNNDLSARGLDIHLSSSFVQKDSYYAHSSDVISSGFFNSDGSIINLYDMLKTLQDNYNSLLTLVQQAKGVLNVSVVDPSGNSYIVANNSVISLSSPYYQDRVSALPSSEQKGAIFTDIYQIVISNSSATALQLISSLPGGLGLPLTPSDPSTGKDYDISRRYDIAPLSLSSLKATSTANGEKLQIQPFQSSQVFSQYIYSRYTDIGLKNALIETTGVTGGTAAVPSSFTWYPDLGNSSDTTASFVWNGTYTGTASNGNGYLTDFAIHTDHPSLNDGNSNSLATINQPSITSAAASYPGIVHAYSFERDVTVPNYQQQAMYCLPGATASNPEDNYPVKLGFFNNDRFLIGKNTCGAYLYLAPSSYSDIIVNGTDYRAVKTVQTGSGNAISIPLIFQYRMTDYYGVSSTGIGNIGGVPNLVT